MTTPIPSPGPGTFRARVAIGDLVREGTIVGELDVLGRRTPIVVPAGLRGAVVALAPSTVEFGTPLVTVDPAALGAAAAAATAGTAAAASAGGLVFRAPTSGRFYSRSAPDKPAFVTAGTDLAPGVTICLLEVMKTFHRVTYGGPDLPERARVARVLVADGDDVNAGDALLALDAGPQ